MARIHSQNRPPSAAQRAAEGAEAQAPAFARWGARLPHAASAARAGPAEHCEQEAVDVRFLAVRVRVAGLASIPVSCPGVGPDSVPVRSPVGLSSLAGLPAPAAVPARRCAVFAAESIGRVLHPPLVFAAAAYVRRRAGSAHRSLSEDPQ